jgi:hypothetical protein
LSRTNQRVAVASVARRLFLEIENAPTANLFETHIATTPEWSLQGWNHDNSLNFQQLPFSQSWLRSFVSKK